MKSNRHRYDAQLKAKIAMEAIRGQRTIAELAGEYGVHPNQIGQWKRQVLDGLPEIFSNKRQKQQQDTEVLQAELYRQIGELKVELDWLKKKHRLIA